MHCDHKNAILDEFLAAAERQEAAASILVSAREPSAFQAAYLAVEECRLEAVRTRVTLEKHLQEHGCYV